MLIRMMYVKKIMVIDGNNIINRAFYALPLLTNAEGEYTNAVYGFLNIFFKLYDEEKPELVAVVFDLPAPTFRHLAYAEYKGTRKSMPDELRPQIPALKNLLQKMNIATLELAGFEADDIMGTIARKAAANGYKAVIVSGDRDLLQIAADDIVIRVPNSKTTATENFYRNDVIAKLGVTPEEYIDVKALMGDTSDNIPGVPGIGEKTAVKIIQQYKNIENAILNAKDVKPKKAGENLEAYKDSAIMSKSLATIDVNVPVEFDTERLKSGDMFNADALAEVKRMGFNSLLPRFAKPEDAADKSSFKIITEPGEARVKIEALTRLETAAFVTDYSDQIKGISFSGGDAAGDSFYVEVNDELPVDMLIGICAPFFAADTKKLTLDSKREMRLLTGYGVEIRNICFDVTLAAYVANQPSVVPGAAGEPPYALASGVVDVYGALRDAIEKNEQQTLYYDIELPLAEVLSDMERLGIRVDADALKDYGQNLQQHLNKLTEEIYRAAGEEFNINSPAQLGVILFEKLGLKATKKTKTGYSTDASVLEGLADKHEIVPLIIEYRTYSKLKSTYFDGLLAAIDERTGKIYSTFNQTAASTGRISSSEPNLQNIPVRLELGRLIRKVFVPSEPDCVFMDADYSQIELRLLAHMSADEQLTEAFNSGVDIHSLTASQVFNVPLELVRPSQRRAAKAVNFGIIYGISAFSLGDDLGINTKEAGKYIDSYFEKYPRIKTFLDDTVKSAKINGYTKTLFNRRREIPELSSKNFNVRSFGERAAMNMPIQGTAADIIKLAMVKVYRRLKAERLQSKLILQVHDELLLEVKIGEIERVRQILKEEMEHAVKLNVNLDIDVHEGGNWFEVK